MKGRMNLRRQNEWKSRTKEQMKILKKEWKKQSKKDEILKDPR